MFRQILSRCRERRESPAGAIAAGFAALILLASATGAEAKPDADTYRRLMQDGIHSNSLGRHRAAEKAFRDALDVCERRSGARGATCVDPTMRLAMEISNQERFQEAGLLFRRAKRLARRSASALDHPRYLTYRAMDYANRGEYAAAMKAVLDANQARKALLKTMAAAARAAGRAAKKRLSLALSDLAHGLYVQASVAFKLGRYQEAKVTAYLSRKLIAKVDHAPDWWVAFVDSLLAEIDFKEGNIEAAEKRLQLALKTKQIALGNTRAVAMSRLALGSVFHQRHRDGDAMRTMRKGLAIVRGELRHAPGIGIARLTPFLNAALAEADRDASRRSALHAEMFAAGQLVRSGDIARTVAQMAARFASGRPEIADLVHRLQSATRRRDELRLGLGKAAISLGGKPDVKRLAGLRDAYVEASGSVTALENRLNSVFPSYANLVSPRPASASEIVKLLRSDEALVRILIGEREGFVFIARPSGLKVARLAISRAEIVKAIRHLRKPFEKAGGRIRSYDLAAAYRLYRKLLGPVERDLAGVKHLIVVSSGAVLSLPFSLLLTQPPAANGKDRYKRAAWLVRETAVTLMPSVRAFASLRGSVRPSKAPLPFLGFGNPAFTGKPGGGGLSALARHCQLDAATPPELIRGLAALPETANEVIRVAKALSTGRDSIYLGARASETQLRNIRLDQYRVIYFATHGLLPGELRCQSEPALALSPPARAGGGAAGDGLLSASEIAALRLDADLVVLSACNTGGGKGGKFGGESLSGLARAFFQAGARSMLVSHWQVDSVATARLMTRLFERLSKRGDGQISDALRGAKLDMIAGQRTAHPFFWAAFTLVGGNRFANDP